MSLLEQILDSTRRRVEETRRGADVRELERRAEAHVARGFRRRLVEVAASGVAVTCCTTAPLALMFAERDAARRAARSARSARVFAVNGEATHAAARWMGAGTPRRRAATPSSMNASASGKR